MSSNTGTIRIGTSGWAYGHWQGAFYPEDLPGERRLPFYARHFDTVEINNSFYHLPAEDTLRRWRQAVPDEFVFAVKASRYITHMKKLKDPADSTRRFRARLDALGDQLGPILFQLPPTWGFDAGRLAGLLETLGKGRRYALEFRDHSWHRPEALEILADHGAAFCIFDLDGFTSPKEVTADFTYLRLHGPDGAYEGSYSDSALAGWAGALSSWAGQGVDVFCYFDNDDQGHAPRNALRLKEMLDDRAG